MQPSARAVGPNDFPRRLVFLSVLPSDKDWLLKIIAIQDRFVLGLYRRQMKAISYSWQDREKIWRRSDDS
ncbi:MAG: hypothetical protein DME99_11210 [Verrucomicrobia bacterium]|nr:MAG: hypothetical protein DME99_11210 [Verrucomicrobiota bacterium]